MHEAAAFSPVVGIVWLLIGYAFGSVPFGLLLTRVAGLGDVRSIGSGNIGATNVLRTGSKKIAFATLLCDILKGAVPVVLGSQFAGEPAGLAAGFGAFIGHVLPIWLKFKGGKGVATYVGILAALSWKLVLIFAAVWLGLAAIFRFSSVSSLGGALAMPLAALVLKLGHLNIVIVPISLIIIYAHRENIGRLKRGEESKIRLKSSAAGE